MQNNRGRDTEPERALRSAVHRRGLRFRVNTRPIASRRRTADLVFPTERVAVYLDGCFWHGCPIHHSVAVTNAQFWADKVRHNRARDDETDRELVNAGWIALRFWEHEDVQQAAARVEEIVRQRRGR